MLPQSCAASAVSVVAAAAVGAEAPAAAPAPAAQQPSQASSAPEGASRQKRYVAASARNGDSPFSVRREWHKKSHPAVSAHRGSQAASAPAPNPSGIPGKRYVGASARGGQLPGKRADDEPEDPIDREMEQSSSEESEAMDESQAAEQQLQRLQEVEDKRSSASLARGGQSPGKRFNDFRDDDDEDMKRGISTSAKNGQSPAPLTPGDNRSEDAADEVAEHKRGGVSALARSGYLPPHKKDSDWSSASSQGQQQFAPAPLEEKRNIGSSARGFNSPPPGKRNSGASARGGGFSQLRYAGAKKNDISDASEADKRSAASSVQHGSAPLGKRFHPLTFGQEERFWHPPQRTGKRSEGEGDGLEEDALEDAEEITKRYVAASSRQGRSPVGGPGGPSPFAGASFSDAGGHDDADGDQSDEEKRHLGASRRISREAPPPPAARAKRQASDEFASPVFQPSDAPADMDDASSQRVSMAGEDAPGAADKRFLGPPPAPLAVAAGPPPPPQPQPPLAAFALAKRHIGASARSGWSPAFHAGTPGERLGRSAAATANRYGYGKRDRSYPADEPEPAAFAAAGDRSTGAAAFAQHLSAEVRAIRRSSARRREQSQSQRYNRIQSPHVVEWKR